MALSKADAEARSDKLVDLRDTVLATADLVLQALMTALEDQNWQMVRSCALAYGVMVDKVAVIEGTALPRYGGVRGQRGGSGLPPGMTQVRDPEATKARIVQLSEELRARREGN